MEPAERIPLIKRCAQTLAGQGWPEIDFLLEQFELPTSNEWGGSGPATEYAYALAMLGQRGVPDENLAALHDYLHGPATHGPEDEPWLGSSCRVFLSHLWSNRDDAVEVKEGLSAWGVDAFVAHRDIEPASEWQQVIIAALHSCDALVALLHDGYQSSKWCDQEAGVAIGRRVPVIPVRVDLNPYGLLGAFQALPWPSHAPNPSKHLARTLVDLLAKDKRTRDRVHEALVTRLVSARSFDEAGEVAGWLVALDANLSTSQLERIRTARGENDQVGMSNRAARPLDTLLAKLVPEPPVESYGPDEAPF